MNRTDRFARASNLWTGAKAISIMFMVGIIALLAARTPMHPMEEAMVATPAALEQSEGDLGAFGSTLPRQDADAAARAAKQDDPPIPTF